MNLWAYTIRRTLYVIPILLGVCLIVFVLFNLVGGDPAITLLGKHATQKQITEIRQELGLNKPLYSQYLDIVKSAVTFDFGRSWNSKQEIFSAIKQKGLVSLSFTIPGFLISTLISIFISILVAFHRGNRIDRSMVIVTVAMMSISSLVYILFGQRIFAYEFGWFEISGYAHSFPDILAYISLPILIWIILSIGPNVRFFRTVVLDELYQDYVRTARSKGLTETVIMLKHVLKNAMIPILTFTVIQIPFLILGALLIESFFSIPGLGGYTLDAINNSDFPVIKAMTILSSVAYIFFTLVTDVLYTVVDPRVRLE